MARLARLLNPIVWRWPGHAPHKLHAFARAEQGSLIDLEQAAAATPSAARAAAYLRHAGDEARHAVLFARWADELCVARGRAPLGPARADTESLFDRLGEVGFLAFVHHGEARGVARFEAHRDYFARRGGAREQALLEAVLGDERRHQRYTRELLVELSGGEPDARRALRRARRWELWRTWRRAGRWLAERGFTAAMLALYVAILPLGLCARLVGGRRGRRRAAARLPEAR